ncbi:MAG TPA: DUF2460 domain-containing protein [Rhizomicrobium sp.]|nr:DUF2460 domain-containing protein [Rhizomicrobium sp.]
MSFHEIRFPTAISFHSSGGPARKTEIVTLGSGFEERNAVWANSRRRYDVGYGVKTLDDVHTVIAFFEARLARLYGFRLKDFSDYKSCSPNADITPLDQAIGTGDGAAATFQLAKTYTSGSASWQRLVKKPVSATTRIAFNGTEQLSGFSVDTTTGIVTFTAAPGAGVAITAGFEFDTPVRFDSDQLSINLADFAAGEIPSVPIVEIAL